MRLAAFLIFFLCSPFFVHAQLGGFGIESPLSIESQPAYPGPGQEAELSLNDYSGGVYGAEITWYLNDTPVPGSRNVRSIKFTAGRAGGTDVVKAVLTSGGVSQVVTKTITPYYLDIIIEPQTHVPGFYKGRALPSVGSTVNVSAIFSDGTALKNRDLIYLWKVNQTVIEGGPLRGRNSISFTMPQDAETILSLQVSTPGGEILAKRTIAIPLAEPQILFYEVNALYGVETQSIKREFTMIGDSATLVAEPFYLDSNTFNYPGLLEWKINGSQVPSGNNPYSLDLQKTGYPGSATLDFHVRNTALTLQGGRKQVLINI